MRLLRKHSLLLVGGASTLVAAGFASYLYFVLDPPLNLVLLVGLPLAEVAAFLFLWFLLRRREPSPDRVAVEQAFARGRPVVVELYSNT